MLAISNFEPMSEPLFLFLMLASSVCIIPAIVRVGDNGGILTTRRLFGGGVFLGLSILTRPAALYLPLIYLMLLVVVWMSRRNIAATLPGAVALLAGTLLMLIPWVIRNYAVFAVPRLTTIDAQNTIYFVGAGAYQVHHRLPLEGAQERIAREFRITPYVAVQNHWVADRSVAEMDDELRGVRWKVLTKYPRDLVLSSLLGVIKASVSHNADHLVVLLGGKWVAPGIGSLLCCRPEAIRRLLQNGPLASTAFVWQLLHILVTLGMALFGVGFALRNPRTRFIGSILLAVLAYFYLTVALFGFEAYCRCRIPVLPFLFTFASLGIHVFLSTSASRSYCGGVMSRHRRMRSVA